MHSLAFSGTGSRSGGLSYKEHHHQHAPLADFPIDWPFLTFSNSDHGRSGSHGRSLGDDFMHRIGVHSVSPDTGKGMQTTPHGKEMNRIFQVDEVLRIGLDWTGFNVSRQQTVNRDTRNILSFAISCCISAFPTVLPRPLVTAINTMLFGLHSRRS